MGHKITSLKISLNFPDDGWAVLVKSKHSQNIKAKDQSYQVDIYKMSSSHTYIGLGN